MGVEAICETRVLGGSKEAAKEARSRVRGFRIRWAESAASFKKAKVSAVARLAGVKVEDEGSALLTGSQRTCVLETKEGPITQSYAVIRYLAGLSPQSGLYGSTAYEEATVDQWLEFCVLEVETAVVAAIEHGKVVEPAARADVEKALKVLNRVLEKRTFLVGERATAADVALVCVLKSVFCDAKLLGPALFKQQYPHALRWYLTVAHACAPELGKGAVDAVKPIASLPREEAKAPKGTAGGGGGAGDPGSLFSRTFARSRVRLKELLSEKSIGSTATVAGWVRSVREAEKGTLCFVELNDGSCLGSLQVVVASGIEGFSEMKGCGGTGASVKAKGEVVESPGKNQAIELRATEVTVLGPTRGGPDRAPGAQYYPLAKKFHTPEHLRAHAHLRPRSRLGSAVVRVRHALAFATHEFFNGLGFLYVHTPLITAADCEGAGEQFTVTTLLPEEGERADTIPRTPEGFVDYSKDFFGRKCGLTVSGQLNVETHAVALSDCYTFGPTFRAEVSHTARHLSEFWMIEPEMAFATLDDDVKLAQDYLKYCVSAVLTRCDDDLAFFEQANEKGLRDRLRSLASARVPRLEYSDAIEILLVAIRDGHDFENKDIAWGVDLNSEHERYLTDVVYKGPVVIVNYPKNIKAFYMKLNPGSNPPTVAAMDLLVPKIGEIIGGSQREDDLETLEQRAKEVGLDPKSISWYADLRRYGSVPHAGFGLGFERLIMLVTGVENIRDVIPFPRYPGHAAF
ncbi:hypothetical protein CTAYLR_004005 [Chrysophaeum taylorii]|uniref:asparagine--tRNA ligase n=1 Tax=Chrysophaeum taylorii TaxID=2483200 RepID=A0AAD7U7U7_9STRA|nr:hypothetical protein CTAYLR_004005 [Chrysophaeum taylorii]